MKLTIAALAISGAIGVAGCQSTGGGSPVSSLNLTQVVLQAQADFGKGCAAVTGSVPSDQSIIAIINAADPKLVVATSVASTALNIATAICVAYGQSGAPASLARANPVVVDGVIVAFQLKK